MNVALRTAPPGARWLVYSHPRGGFDYMPEGAQLFEDERVIARRLSLAQAIAKVDGLHAAAHAGLLSLA